MKKLTEKQKQMRKKYSKLSLFIILANAILSAGVSVWIYSNDPSYYKGFWVYMVFYLSIFTFCMIVVLLNMFVLYLYKKYNLGGKNAEKIN